jgi:translation initiation factor 2 beta subunit (eIF-2beta)/eIF-5
LLVLCLSTGVSINNEGKFNVVLKLIVSLIVVFFKKALFVQMFKTCPTVREAEKPIIVFSHMY